MIRKGLAILGRGGLLALWSAAARRRFLGGGLPPPPEAGRGAKAASRLCESGGKPPHSINTLPNVRDSRRGFTIFEVLAVMTVISIALVIVLGSYGSWATIHALDSAAKTLEAGLLSARATAKAKNTYVMITYSTPTTNALARSEYSTWACYCTSTNGMEVVNPFSPEFDDTMLVFTSTQRLTRHVTLARIIGGAPDPAPDIGQFLTFAPDGSLLVDEANGELPEPHDLLISTRRRFAVSGASTEPLHRVIRVDYATGLPKVLRPDQLTGGQ